MTSATAPPRSRLLIVRRMLDAALLLLAALYAVSIPFQSVHVDEPWFGELAYRFANEGTPRSVLFTGLAGYEDRVLTIHKLFVYLGSLTVLVLGWHVWSLRLVSLVAGAVLVWMLRSLLMAKQREAGGLEWRIACVFLLVSPLFFRFVNIYRPEALLSACGFASYFWLVRYLDSGRHRHLILSGVFAGLAPLVHIHGLLFIGAGAVVLALGRRFAELAVLTSVSLAITGLYFWDVVGNWELFKFQLSESPAIHSDMRVWYDPLLQLIDEHKRLFRKPEIIFTTMTFLGALCYQLRRRTPRITISVVYALMCIVGLGLLAQRKTTAYAIVLFPFFAVVVAQSTAAWLSDWKNRWPRFAVVGALIWSAFQINGVAIDAAQAKTDKQDIVRSNRRLASVVPEGSTVLAPLDFVFEEIDSYRIRGQETTRILLSRKERRSGDLHTAYHGRHYLDWADAHAIPYVILDPADVIDSGWPLPEPGHMLLGFIVLYRDPETDRIVLGRAGMDL